MAVHIRIEPHSFGGALRESIIDYRLSIIDDDLSWKHHIFKVTSKISRLCGIMVRARHCLPIRTLRTVYNAVVYPYLSYCNIV